QLINYQGLLMDPGTGQPVADATYSITFSIYDVASGGSAIWIETQDVQTKDGSYSVLLGSTTPLTPTIFSGPEKYLGIKVGSDPEMTPRKQIVSVAYAITSSGVSGTSNIFPSDGKVGIGTLNPGSNLQLYDDSTACWMALKGVGSEFDYSALNLEATNGSMWTLNHKLGGFPNYFVIQESNGTNWWGRFTIIPGGNVGIGNWLTPEQLLHLKSGDDPTLKIQSDGDDEISGRVSLRQSDDTGYDIYYDGRTDLEGLAFQNFEQGAANNVGMFIKDGGNVGIGTFNPNEKLEVAGIVHSTEGGFKFPDGSIQSTAAGSASTQYYTIAPSDFTEITSSAGIGEYYIGQTPISIGSCRLSGMGSLMAPAHFPHGAVLTEITVYFYDDAPGNLEIYFNRAGLSGAFDVDELFSYTTSGTPGHASTSGTLNVTVDNSTYCYELVASSTAWDSNYRLIIKAAVFKYTIN
ncbi:MAG: hypothetical protein JSW07_05065, partial [bacterium]